ncbi:hypothetical protein FNW52_01060 [Flavobacterium sp. ZT3R18]|uniref:hypothetical protein n=1 Tax=Flavobacterium sp. ZT3R18 TaxID=2594429 RepID=UPI001179A05B|nr:hypothetical protein [Flavobacterium sp. ZT3R18]TRX38666.1 hypothetical protein FNW52_01060 [Flavobacterium sp. ZT3R18]
MNKKIYIFLLAVFGFLMIPNTAFACGNSYSKKAACKKEVSSKQETKDCCDSHNNQNGKRHHGCGGKCGHSNCNISSVQIAVIAPYVAGINTKALFFYEKEEGFDDLKTTISSGFQSLWLIPKIG